MNINQVPNINAENTMRPSFTFIASEIIAKEKEISLAHELIEQRDYNEGKGQVPQSRVGKVNLVPQRLQ
jgi:hypothetical protein